MSDKNFISNLGGLSSWLGAIRLSLDSAPRSWQKFGGYITRQLLRECLISVVAKLGASSFKRGILAWEYYGESPEACLRMFAPVKRETPGSRSSLVIMAPSVC